jgi:hypothetical protein
MQHESDQDREGALVAMISDLLGKELQLVSAFLETSTWVITERWETNRVRGWDKQPAATLVGASDALDALAASRRNLLAADLTGVYVELRRCFEGQILALAAYHDQAIAAAWLAGKDLRPRELRAAVVAAEPRAEPVLRRLYKLLSEHAHIRVESTGVHGNRWGRFEWPARAATIDPEAVLGAFDSHVAFTWNFANAQELMTDGWTTLSDRPLAAHALKMYGWLSYYVEHHARGKGTVANWIRTDPASAGDWLSLPTRLDGSGDPD